jgi:hypothetical protein
MSPSVGRLPLDVPILFFLRVPVEQLCPRLPFDRKWQPNLSNAVIERPHHHRMMATGFGCIKYFGGYLLNKFVNVVILTAYDTFGPRQVRLT